MSQLHSHRFRLSIALIAVGLLTAGCAGGLGSADYSRDQARTVHDVQFGTVEHVREVKIEGTKSGVGGAAGAVAGSIAGGELGRGRGSAVGSVLGAVAGGVAGAAVEEAATRQKGVEVTVRLESGRIIAITQATDEVFRVGERVRVLSGRGVTRVTH